MRDLPTKRSVLEILSHLCLFMKSQNGRGSGSILWAYARILSLVFQHFTIHSFLLTHIPVLMSFTQIWTRIPWHSFPVTGNVSCARLLFMIDQSQTLISHSRISVSHSCVKWLIRYLTPSVFYNIRQWLHNYTVIVREFLYKSFFNSTRFLLSWVYTFSEQFTV